MYYLAPKCLYRGEYKQIQLRVLSPSRLGECMNDVLCALYPMSSMLDAPLYSPRRDLGSQIIGVRIGFDRGMVHTGVASSRLVMVYFGDDGACVF